MPSFLQPCYTTSRSPSSAEISSNTYLKCGELLFDAIEASVESPGSCGNEALWWRLDPVVEAEEGREMGSKLGKDCRPSSAGWAAG